MSPDEKPEETFEAHASKPGRTAAGAFVHFLLTNKKWWLIPIVAALALVALLVVLGGSGMAPFIYSLF